MFFAKQLFFLFVQELLQTGDVGTVCSVVQDLRRICNSASLFSTPVRRHHRTSTRLPAWTRLHPRPARLVEKLLESRPLDTVSLENINLVFLKQELTTTGTAIYDPFKYVLFCCNTYI